MDYIRVLFVDDEKTLLKATKLYLEKIEPSLQIITASSAKKALKLLREEPFDVVISDYQMPDMDGLDLLQKIRETANDIPYIIFTGKGREEVVINALNLGADFYLQKGGDVSSQFSSLINLIKKTYEKRKMEQTLRKSEEKFSKAFNYSFNSMSINRLKDTSFIDINQQFALMFNYSPAEITGKTFEEINFWAKNDDLQKFLQLLFDNNEVKDFETVLMTKDSEIISVQISASLIDIEGEICMLMVIKDISEIIKMVEILKESEYKYKLIFEESPVAFLNINLFDARLRLEKFPKRQLKNILTSVKNSSLFSELLPLIKVNDLNQLALKMFAVSQKEEFFQCMRQQVFQKNIPILSSIIMKLLFPKAIVFHKPFILINCKGESRKIMLNMKEVSKIKGTWSNILISIIEIPTEIEGNK
ncbi:MAG: response regulator [Candidatus Heimdallarchaeota archaeon]|nr:response regulator [Candidatus Heimdallarchaeota archaeon]